MATFQDFFNDAMREAAGFRVGPNTNVLTASQRAGERAANLLTAGGQTALGQSLAMLNTLLAQQGALDPQIVRNLERGVLRGTQQAQIGAEQFAGRSGIRGPAFSAIQSGIGGAGLDRLTNLRAQLAQAQQNRQLQLIGLTNQSVTQPALGLAGLGQQAILQNQALDAQRGDPLTQALGIGLGAAGTFFGGPAGGRLLGNVFPNLFG